MAQSRLLQASEALANVIVAAAAVVVVWFLIVHGGQAAPSPAGPSRSGNLQVKPPQAPISVSGAPSRGQDTASVVLVEYSDFQCPYCGKFVRDVLPTIQKEYIDSGRVRLVFMNYPLEPIHPHALRAAESAECAAREGKFWEMHDLLFEHQANLTDDDLANYARSAGLDDALFDACMKGDAGRRVSADQTAAKALGINSTPMFFIGRALPNGRVQAQQSVAGSQSVEAFRLVLDKAIRNASGTR